MKKLIANPDYVYLFSGLHIVSIQSILIDIQIQFTHYAHLPKKESGQKQIILKRLYFYGLRLFRINGIQYLTKKRTV